MINKTINTLEELIESLKKRIEFGEYLGIDKEPENYDSKSGLHGQYIAFERILEDLGVLESSNPWLKDENEEDNENDD